MSSKSSKLRLYSESDEEEEEKDSKASKSSVFERLGSSAKGSGMVNCGYNKLLYI